MTIFEKLRGRRDQSTAKSTGDYASLVRRVATSAKVSESEVEAALSAAGVSVDQFEQDVELFNTRSKLRAAADEVEERRHAVNALGDDRTKLAGRYAAAQSAFATEERDLIARENAAVQRFRESNAARKELVASPPRWLKETIANLRSELADARRDAHATRQSLDDYREEVRGRSAAGDPVDESEATCRRIQGDLDLKADQVANLEQRERKYLALAEEVWPVPSDLEQ